MITQFLIFFFVGASSFVAAFLLMRAKPGKSAIKFVRKLFQRRVTPVFLRPYQTPKY